MINLSLHVVVTTKSFCMITPVSAAELRNPEVYECYWCGFNHKQMQQTREHFNSFKEVLKVTYGSLICMPSCPESLSLLWYAVKSMCLHWWAGLDCQPTTKAYWLTTYNTGFLPRNHTGNSQKSLTVAWIRSGRPVLLIACFGDESEKRMITSQTIFHVTSQ